MAGDGDASGAFGLRVPTQTEQNWMAGVTLAVISNWHVLKECMFSCSSWLELVEKILALVVITIGIAKPGAIAYRFLMRLLSRISDKLFSSPLHLTEDQERGLQVEYYFDVTSIDSM
jgi:hypothetical protein